jgi:glycosyltransferase involved in cell wall biosynthesis
LWPEPFGRTGLDAAAHALPSVGFAVGGIPDWLVEGVNGHLAPGDPPTVDGLVDAIVLALRNPDHHAALRQGALTAARKASGRGHVAALLDVLARAAGR